MSIMLSTLIAVSPLYAGIPAKYDRIADKIEQQLSSNFDKRQFYTMCAYTLFAVSLPFAYTFAKSLFASTPKQKDIPKFTFKEIAGGVPAEVQDVVDFMDMHKGVMYAASGVRMPKGLLMVGPPGTGKTSIARAIAGEVNAEFFPACAASFVTPYQGSGPENVRNLFDDARKATKVGKTAIIFIDEIDAIVGRDSQVWCSQEQKNTLNELLNQMDGMDKTSRVFVIGATNRSLDLDAALKRPGRFDRIITIGLPDQVKRKEVLDLYLDKLYPRPTIDTDALAKKTDKWSPAALEVLVNEAGMIAMRNNALRVKEVHIEQAYREQLARQKY